MSKTITGVVSKVFKNNGGYYAIKLDDDNNWYGGTKVHPGVEEGEEISMSVEKQGKYWKFDKDSITYPDKEKEDEPVTANGPKKTSNKKTETKDGYWENKDKLTRFHAARATAVDVVLRALEQGVLPFPAGKGAKNAKFDHVKAVVAELTAEMYLDSVDPDTYCDTVKKSKAILNNAKDVDDDNEESSSTSSDD